jgi:hypothetical protein
VEKTDNGDGTWTVRFLCASGGTYKAEVGFKKVIVNSSSNTSEENDNTSYSFVEHIKESPFTLRVIPSDVSPEQSETFGTLASTDACECGGTTRILLQLFSAPGVPLRGGGHNVRMSLSPDAPEGGGTRSALGKRISTIDFKIEDHGDGFYTGSSSLTRSGEYNLWVRVGGWDTNSSHSAAHSKSPFLTEAGAAGGKSSVALAPVTPVAGFPRKVYVAEGPPHARTCSVDVSQFQQPMNLHGHNQVRPATPPLYRRRRCSPQPNSSRSQLELSTSAGSASQFSLHLKDVYGNYTSCQPHEIEVYVRYMDADVPFSVVERKAGIYDVDFKPSKAGQVTVLCFVMGVGGGENPAGVGVGGVAGDDQFDPYDHQYQQQLQQQQQQQQNDTNAPSRVLIAGCPIKIDVRNIPIAKRLSAKFSSVHLLASRLGEEPVR